MTRDGIAEHKPAEAAAEARPHADHRWLVLVVVSVAQLMVVLDATVVNIAMPTAQADLGFHDSQRQWVVTAYSLVFGSLLLLGGRIGDLVGRKRTFLCALAGFAFASALGGAAPSFAVLVAARALQGVAGAMLAPAALSTIVTTFHDPRDRSRAFGVFGTVSVAGGAVGLILGGVLTEYLSWRWCMYVNVGFAAAAFFGAVGYMPEAKPPVRPQIDWVGTVLAAAGLFAVVFGLSQAESESWGAPRTITSLAVGVALLAGFVRAENIVRSPLLPLRVVADRVRGVAFASVAISAMAVFGLSLFLNYYMQHVKGFSPVQSGLSFLPLAGGVVISANTSNIVMLPRLGPRIVIPLGMTFGFFGIGYLSRLDAHSSYVGGVLPGLIVLGFSMGMVMAPSMNTATTGVRQQDAGVTAALVSTMQQVGGSIGIAVMSTIAASATADYAASHQPIAGFDAVAATHGYTAAFTAVAAVYVVGAVFGALLFPGKAQIADMREQAHAGATQSAIQPTTAPVAAAAEA